MPEGDEPSVMAQLRARLAQAEATLEALRSGRVDVLIGDDSPILLRLKTLEEEKQRMEAHLRQQQKLESIGTLASGVAHEINNPLNGILNYAQLILDQLGPSHAAAEYAQEIQHEAGRIAHVVKQLLAFARPQPHPRSQVRPLDLVEGTLTLMRAVLRRDQIQVAVEVPESLPRLRCRGQEIQQVLMNLMTNARDALNQRYTGYDPAKRLLVRGAAFEREACPWVRLTVEDHGPGIAPELRERLFEPFFTTKDRAQGTGLGLWVSHRIVKDHQGALWVESEVNRFTRFHLELPVHGPREERPGAHGATSER